MMAKVKLHPQLQDEAVNVNGASGSLRRTRRQTKAQAVKQEHLDSSPEPEQNGEPASITRLGDVQHINSSPPSSPAPDQAEPKSRRRKSIVSKVISQPPMAPTGKSPNLSPQPELGKKRGGNKRKHTHEYCLTCRNYGRACGGRRDDTEGCAVCREPDRSKGEKLRECLWANPEAGIFTYQQAREVHKKAQAAERAARGKAPTKRQLQYLDNQDLSKISEAFLSRPDPLGLVEPRRYSLNLMPPPPPNKRLDLLPPTMESRQLPSLNRHVDHNYSTVGHRYEEHDKTHNDHNDRDNRLQSQAQYPRAQLSNSMNPYIRSGPNSANSEIQSSVPRMLPIDQRLPGGQPTDKNGFRVPYYDPNLNAFVLPAYPYSNLLPPHMQGKVANQAYISPYDAYPCIPIAISDSNPPRPVIYPPGLPPPNMSYSIPKPAYLKPRPLDKTGQPCRKWSRSNSIVKNVGGYPLQLKSWKTGASHDSNGHGDRDNNEDEDGDSLVAEGDARSSKADTNKDEESQHDHTSDRGSAEKTDEEISEQPDPKSNELQPTTQPKTMEIDNKTSKEGEQTRFNRIFQQAAKQKRPNSLATSSEAMAIDPSTDISYRTGEATHDNS